MLLDEGRAFGPNVGRHDGPGVAHQARDVGGLPARRGADVEHAVARLGIERCDDERRCLILHGEPALREPAQSRRIATVQEHAVGMELREMRRMAARAETADEDLDRCPAGVRSKAQETPLAERLRGHLRLVVAEEEAQLAHGPRRHPRTDEDVVIRRTGWWGGRILGDLPQDRVHETPFPRRGKVDRLGHRGVPGDPHEQQLVRAQTQRGARAGAHPRHRPRRPEPDRAIQPGDVAQRAERELRRERAVARGQPRTLQERGEHPGRVRVLVGDATNRLDRDRPGRGHEPSRSPTRSRTPRAQSAAGIRRLPEAATSSNRTAPAPAATMTPSRSTSTTVPGGAAAAAASSARRTLRSLPLKTVLAPGSGANARTHRTTAPAGWSQSMHPIAGSRAWARASWNRSGVPASPARRRDRGPSRRPDRLRSSPGDPPANRRHHPTGSAPLGAQGRAPCPGLRPSG